jgi:hypothetical protein
MDSPAEEDGFEPSVPREKDGEKADESISQLSLAGSVNAQRDAPFAAGSNGDRGCAIWPAV